MNSYDTLIIGDERDGFEAAIEIARSGRRVAIVSPVDELFPWTLVREAADRIASQPNRGQNAWQNEVRRLVEEQNANDELDLMCSDVNRIRGRARFLAPGAIEVDVAGGARETLRVDDFVLACGTRSYLPHFLRVDGRAVFGQESLLSLREIPRSALVIGAGETGLSTAVTLAKLGSEVTVIDDRLTIAQLYGAFNPLLDQAQSLNVAFRLDDEVIGTEMRPDDQVAARTASGRVFVGDAIVVCVGREGCTEELRLERAGVGVDERGRVWCDEEGWTWNESIRAVGSVRGHLHKQPFSTKSTIRSNTGSRRFVEAGI